MSETPDSKPIPCLGIVPAPSYHCRVMVYGDRLGLEALRDTIIAALEHGAAESLCLVPHDGEEFAVQVHCVPNGEMELCRHVYLRDAEHVAQARWERQLEEWGALKPMSEWTFGKKP